MILIKRSMFGLSSLIGFALFVGWEYLANGPKSAARIPVLVNEWNRIQPIHGASSAGPSKISKPDLASVDAEYACEPECSENFPWYEAEMTRHGWSFAGLQSASRTTTRHCAKADYAAFVECIDVGGGWRCAVGMHWQGSTRGLIGLAVFAGFVAFTWTLLSVTSHLARNLKNRSVRFD